MIKFQTDTAIGDIPSDWGKSPLRQLLVKHLPGNWGEDRGEHYFKTIRSTNLTNHGHLDLSDVAIRSMSLKDGVPLQPLAHDIFLERSGGGPGQPVGRVGLVRADMPGFAFSNFLQLLRPNEKLIHPVYLCWVLYLLNRTGRIVRLEQQTTQMRNLHFRDYLTVVVPVPPPLEQQAIVRILEFADSAIEKAHTSIKTAATLKKGLAQELFTKGIGHKKFVKTHLGPIPDRWAIVSVGSVLTEAQYGLSMPMFAKGRFPILRMAAIQDGQVLLDDLKYVDLPDAVADTYLLKRGDILFNRTNSAELVGKVGVCRSDDLAVFASYLIRLKADSSKVNNYFLGQLLASYPVQCRFKRYATPGVQQVNINATNLQRVEIAIPVGYDALKEQNAIAEILERQDEKIRGLEAHVATLQKLKRGLMLDLLTGRVRVKFPAAGSTAVARSRP